MQGSCQGRIKGRRCDRTKPMKNLQHTRRRTSSFYVFLQSQLSKIGKVSGTDGK